MSFNAPHQPNPQIGSILSSGNSASAKMIILTPRNHGNVAIRPTIFDFNQGLMDKMLSNYDAKHVASRFSMERTLIESIKPSNEGIAVDTRSCIDNLNSFILIIDSVGQAPNQFVKPQRRRQILTGYFLDEPIAPNTWYSSQPTINYNCPMVFTHDCVTAVTQQVNANGTRQAFSVVNNNDIINPLINHQVPGNDLYLVDSGSIAKCSTPSDNGIIKTDAGAALAGQESASVIGVGARSAKHQLLSLADALTSASAVFSGGYESFGSNDSRIGLDPYDRFLSEFLTQVGTSGSNVLQRNGIDSSRIVTIGQIDAMLMTSRMPQLNINPIKIPQSPTYERRHQGEKSPQNVFSSMACSAIQALAYEYQIGSISFRYNSRHREPGSMSNGSWALMSATSLLGGTNVVDENGLRSCLAGFRNALATTLFPTLIAIAGDFDIMVAYEATGVTVMDLNFYDYNPVGGVYEHDNLMGGLLCPAIGTYGQFQHNQAQLEFFAATAASAVVGNNAMNYPITNSRPNFIVPNI
jgi:hypothetical protein